MQAELIHGFLNYLRYEKRYSPLTAAAYEHDLLSFDAYLKQVYDDVPVETLKHHHLRSWLASLKDEHNMAATSLNRKLASVSSFFRYLIKSGHANENPVRRLHAIRRPERLPAFLKETETKALLEEKDFPAGFRGATDRLICELLYRTGMRRAELIGLREQDVEWGVSLLRVLGKGNKERLIPVSRELLHLIRDYRKQKAYLGLHSTDKLLVLEEGKPLYPMYVARVMNRQLKDVTSLQKKSPHVLRHTFATHLLNSGANIQAIKDLLGHSSLAATQVYAHTNIEQLKEVYRKAHPRASSDKT